MKPNSWFPVCWRMCLSCFQSRTPGNSFEAHPPHDFHFCISLVLLITHRQWDTEHKLAECSQNHNDMLKIMWHWRRLQRDTLFSEVIKFLICCVCHHRVCCEAFHSAFLCFSLWLAVYPTGWWLSIIICDNCCFWSLYQTRIPVSLTGRMMNDNIVKHSCINIAYFFIVCHTVH